MSNIVQENDCEEQLNTIEAKAYNAKTWGTRHIQCVILFLTLTIAYSMRSCMGVALVAMASYNSSHLMNGNDSATDLTFGSNFTEGSDSKEFEVNGFFNALLLTPPYPQFKWSKKVQNFMISAFFWGYMALQIPAGQLAYKFGARYLLFGSLMINCVVSLMFPIASYYGGWILGSICRLIQGLSQASIVSSFHTVLSKWSPVAERGRMSAIIYGGQSLGAVLGLPLTGFIASSSLGWPGIFYFYGTLSGIITIIIWFCLADSPAQHRSISVAERKYIEESLGNTKDKKRLPVPWKSMLTDRGMIAIIAAHIAMSWGSLVLYSEVPAYMDKVMGVNIKTNGLLTALPFMVMFFTNFFFSWLSDMLIVNKYLNVEQTRKIANTIGSLPAIGFVVLAFAPKNIYVIESILVIICAFKISSHFGFYINHIDISPNFAGVMMSVSNFSSNFVASFSPIIDGLILTDVTDEYLWRNVFFLTGGLYFFTNIIYVVFGKGEVADWNDSTQYEKVFLSDRVDVEKNKKNISDNNGDLNKVDNGNMH